MPITLENYVSRYKKTKQFLTAHPEKKEMLERKLKEQADDIVRCAVSMYYPEAPPGLV